MRGTVNYYNEHDPRAAEWLRELIKAGHIPAGDVDERDIQTVKPDDITAYTQCHFFAGIGGWSLALRLAGWPDDEPVWTGSCPCQPFSCAGKGLGTGDERHLWPVFRELIRECRPPVAFGEQVASAAGREWLSGTHSHLQRMQDRETVFRVLCQLEGRPWKVQGVHYSPAARLWTNARTAREHVVQGVEAEKPREGAGYDCQIPGQAQGVVIQPRCGGNPKEGGCRQMRANGHPIQSGEWQDMGQSKPGQDRLQTRLHNGKCEGCSLLPERDGEHLGAEQDRRNLQCDHGSTQECERRLSEQVNCELEAEIASGFKSGVCPDLEGMGYTVGAADTCAAGVGAPHRRQRLFWVADSNQWRCNSRGGEQSKAAEPESRDCQPEQRSCAGGVADTQCAQWRTPTPGWNAINGSYCGREEATGRNGADSQAGRMANPEGGGLRINGRSPRQPGHTDECGQADGMVQPGKPGLEGLAGNVNDRDQPGRLNAQPCGPTAAASSIGAWDRFDVLPFRDGKARRVEAGTFPLAYGLPGRVGLLRGYGNAIVPQVAAEFIQAAREAFQQRHLSPGCPASVTR